MASYETEQQKLQTLLQEILSDKGDNEKYEDDVLFGDIYLSDGYSLSYEAYSSDDSMKREPWKKNI